MEFSFSPCRTPDNFWNRRLRQLRLCTDILLLLVVDIQWSQSLEDGFWWMWRNFYWCGYMVLVDRHSRYTIFCYALGFWFQTSFMKPKFVCISHFLYPWYLFFYWTMSLIIFSSDSFTLSVLVTISLCLGWSKKW